MISELSNHHRFLLMLKPKEIVQSNETHWVCKWQWPNAVKSQCIALIRCLKGNQDNGEVVSGGKWVVSAHDHPQFIACLMILEDLMRVVHVVHKKLQSTNTTVSDVASVINSLRTHFQLYKEGGSLGWHVKPDETVL